METKKTVLDTHFTGVDLALYCLVVYQGQVSIGLMGGKRKIYENKDILGL